MAEYGDPRFSARFWRRVEVDANGCWLWTGCVANNGYGKFSSRLVHRDTYQRLVGPIPDGLQIDHLCRVRACCRPDHLEPVTASVNQRRSPISHRERNGYAKRDRCKNGHEFTPDNVYYRRNKYGQNRECRRCHLAACERYRQNRREKARAEQ